MMFYELLHVGLYGDKKKGLNKLIFDKMGSYGLWFKIMMPKFIIWREDYD